MNTLQARQFEMLLRVDEFGHLHTEAFPASSPGGQAFETLGHSVRELRDHAVSKLSTAREGLQQKSTARAQLLEHLELVKRWSALIAKAVPGFDAPFKAPRPRSHQALLAIGRAAIQEATRAEAQFLNYGMPKDFLTELTKLVDAFATAVQHWESVRNEHAAVRTSIREDFAAAFEQLAKLDLIVVTEFRFDAVTLARWEQARRIEYPQKSRRVKAETSGDAIQEVHPEPPPAVAEPVKEVA